ncbi:MFS transporter [Steroidobacter flavus]|uniref:MFS transporter n=1 Tax=Steroidobacter flavus TaxID=1842136 RepID=A0ABV8SZ42_9GAMM
MADNLARRVIPAAESVPTMAMDAEKQWPPSRTAWYVAIMLMLANTLSFVDRQVFALLVQPIKMDLQISDTAISVLYGLSFTLFYVIVGIPVARLADRSSRRNIIAASVFVWSLATALCGVAKNFTQLFVARVGVGAGEGGLGPAAYSMLADYFPPQRLPAAMGVYQVGVYMGGAAALLLGGALSTVIPPGESITLPLLGTMKGWHLVFLALGVPGVLLALLLLTVREPRRMEHKGSEAKVPLPQFFAHVNSRKMAYFGIGLGFALMILVGNGSAAWIPAFLERKYGWTTAQIGAVYGLIVFFCGTSGTLAGGLFAATLRKRGVELANLYAPLLGFVLLIPITIAYPLMATAHAALVLIGMMNFFAGFNFGGGLAALQELTPNRMRALVSAGYMLTINLIGAALGPTIIALCTDYWFGDPRRLHEAIALVCAVASPLSVVALLIGIRGYKAAKLQGL